MAESEIAWLDLEGASNVRDLGGLPAATGRTRHGVLLRSDALDVLTAADVAALASVGVAHVVDLRDGRRAGRAGAQACSVRPARPTPTWRPSTTPSGCSASAPTLALRRRRVHLIT